MRRDITRGKLVAGTLVNHISCAISISRAAETAVLSFSWPARSHHGDGCSHSATTKAGAPSPQRDKPRKPTGDASLLTAPASAALDAPGKPSWRPNTSYVPWADRITLLLIATTAPVPGV